MKRSTMMIAVAAAFSTFLARSGLVLGAPLELVVEADVHAKLPDAHKGLYVKTDDGKFKLDVSGGEDTSGLKSALEKERKAAKEQERLRKELEKKFEGLDPEEYRKMMEKLGGDEEAALIKAGKIDEVVSRRMEKARKDLERQVAAAQTDAKKALDARDKYAGRVLDNQIRAAALKAGMHPNAVDDALFRARTIFTLNEEGEAVQLDKDGAVVMGKDSKSAFTPSEWLEGMKETAPHWYPAGSSGGGAGGSGKGAGGAKQMKRTAFDALNPVDRSNFIKEKGVVVD